MNVAPELLLVGAVAGVGILHTLVPDHWVPITLVARQQRWTRREVVRAAAIAGTGHTCSTLLIGIIVWGAGVAFASKFGNLVSNVSSIALILFGLWIAMTSIRELRSGHGHESDLSETLGAAHGRQSVRTTLLLILGSSPMIEGIPAFFAAAKYGRGLIAVMAAVFAVSTIATYVALCVASTTGLERVKFGAFERYGEVLSGVFIAIIGTVFLALPAL